MKTQRRRRQRGGIGCGPGGCPIAPYKMGGGRSGGGGEKGLSSMSYGSNFVMPNTSSGILGVGQSGGNCDGQCGITPPVTGAMTGGGAGWTSGTNAAFVGKPWTATKWPGSEGIDGDRNYYSLNTYKVDPQTMMKLKGGWKIKGAVVAQPVIGNKTRHGRRARSSRRHSTRLSRSSHSLSYHSLSSRSSSRSRSHHRSLYEKIMKKKYRNKNRKSKENRSKSRSRSRSRSRRSHKRRGGGLTSLMPQDILNGIRGVEYNATNAYRTFYAEKPAVNPLPFKDQYGARS